MQFVQDIEYPREFPALLMDLSREVLREQPANIYQFALEYFTTLRNAGAKTGSMNAADAERD